LEDDSIDEDLCGRKCRAPYDHPWGNVDYHNAIIVCLVNSDSTDSNDKVRVLFTHPITQSMVPCQYYLSDKCRYNDAECRNSHGHVVDISLLEEYEDPDYSKLTLGSHCLVKQDNGLWQPGTISAIVEGHYQVKLSSVNKDVAAGPEELWPLSEDEDAVSEGSDKEVEPADEGQIDQPVVRTLSTVSSGFGDWEKHTSGIGSKLLHKMGFIKGQGLGRGKDGIKEPIDIVVLPTGRSLDVCAELREKNLLHKPFKRKKARPLQKQSGSEASVFDFINHKLGPKIGQPGEGGQPRKQKSKGRGPEGANYFHFDDIPIKKQKTEKSKGGDKLDGNLNVKVCLASITNSLPSCTKRMMLIAVGQDSGTTEIS
jgi:hypothetical protein